MSHTALIVGAGIGGLSAGLALRQAGWNVRIFERATSPRELGFGLGLAPNAIAALTDLGVGEAVVARGFEPRLGEARRIDGTVLKRLELPPGALGGPMVMTLRPALHGALLEALGTHAIEFASEATAFTATDRRVTLHTADVQGIEGDLLVGADGVGSMVRRTLHPTEPPPRSSGIVAVRGVVHGVLHHLRELHAVYYLGRGVESMLIRASDTGIYWFLSVARALVPPDLRDLHDAAGLLAFMAPRFDSTFRAVTSATEDMRYDDLVDRDPIPFWGKDVVTLLGDAAHPVLPHTGQGAAQAIVDAVALGRALEHTDGDVPRALRAYEHERRAKTARLLRQGRRTARMMGTLNPLACCAREVVLRLAPVKPFAKFYVRINRRAGTDVTSRRDVR